MPGRTDEGGLCDTGSQSPVQCEPRLQQIGGRKGVTVSSPHSKVAVHE